MNKYLFFIIYFLFLNNLQSQVLYNETFDNYTLGNLGTDYTGVIPGQGGWLTGGPSMPLPKDNAGFTIVAETNKGKVLSLNSSTPPPYNLTHVLAKRPDINTLIDSRTAGNNVIKFEIDYFTGAQHTHSHIGQHNVIAITKDTNTDNNFNTLIGFYFSTKTGVMSIFYSDGKKTHSTIALNNNSSHLNPPTLPFNTWVKFNVYLDYNNKKIYFETPYFNKVVKGDFLNLSTSTNLMQDYKPAAISVSMVMEGVTSTHQMVNKYDNIKLTALQAVPPHVLSTDNFLAEKFNLFPNPATNEVNVTNNENMLVNQIVIYDINGKQLNIQNFNNEAEIQLNVENLTSGTYMLHLQTNEGTAVKKLVKK